MPFNWLDYRTGIRAVIGAAWPEVKPQGIYTVVRVQEVPLEDTELPYAVVQRGVAVLSQEYSGLTSQAYEIEMRLSYVAQQDTGTVVEEVVEQKLVDLEEYLLSIGITPGQVLEVRSLDITETNPLNALFLERGKPFLAGTLTLNTLVGNHRTP